ncbi:PREDICTED: cytochrome c oxidase assembly protein COX19 [Ceratosolen solmsi marchali]|uniref:Cytochrome c oxidase assembly protein COX19 n=1 Tax=Ceratosolen solmsi marchali TaxID=326594 RepID=A0AAJ7E3F1_9HYME|nr:PREDICTED: cytochrome c oxidase assembly protein COX19 [Ceratosolen solmsi marchali]
MSLIFGKKLLKPTPPEKGNFPLDHEAVCRKFMAKYLQCLLEKNNHASECKDISKSYLKCRMDNDLMIRMDWSELGFDENTENNDESNATKSVEKKVEKKVEKNTGNKQ